LKRRKKMSNFEIGDLITFTYPAVHQQKTKAHDKFPQVFVLHSNWRDNVHGLNFNYLSNDEINVIRMIIDPSFQLKYFFNLQKKNPNLANEFDRIMAAAGSSPPVTSPYDFYTKFIKPFIRIRGYDPYRLYNTGKMTGIRIVQRQRVMVGAAKAPLFGSTKVRDKGKDEKGILKDLAKRQVTQDQGGFPGSPTSGPGYVLTPTEKRFIQRLQGDAKGLFDKYKKQFTGARGSKLPSGAPSFKKRWF